MKLIGTVIVEKKQQLFVTLLFAFVIIIIASSVMYYAERNVQPEAFSSIPQAMWWGISVFTTAYGDVYPITPIGRVLGSFIALIGVGIVALPTGILASGFTEALNRKRREEERKQSKK